MVKVSDTLLQVSRGKQFTLTVRTVDVFWSEVSDAQQLPVSISAH